MPVPAIGRGLCFGIERIADGEKNPINLQSVERRDLRLSLAFYDYSEHFFISTLQSTTLGGSEDSVILCLSIWLG